MRPLNLLAMANSIAAYAQLHGDVQQHSLNEPGMIDQGQYGDTHYYMIPADTLPILPARHRGRARRPWRCPTRSFGC